MLLSKSHSSTNTRENLGNLEAFVEAFEAPFGKRRSSNKVHVLVDTIVSKDAKSPLRLPLNLLNEVGVSTSYKHVSG